MVAARAYILLLCIATAPAAAAELAIGTFRIALGAERSAVMREAQARFHLVPVQGQPETFFLSETRPPNVRVIGGIRFANGRLVWIQRTWGQFEEKVTSSEVSKALFGAIESAATATGASASVSTKIQRVPGAEFRTIYFDFPGGRRITVLTTEGDAKQGGNQVSIDESVSLP